MKIRSHRKADNAAVMSLTLLSALVLAACSHHASAPKVNAAPTDGVLTVGLLGDIGQPPDPDVYYANNGLAITLNTYEGLVQYKNQSDTAQIVPRLATSWSVSPDHTVYTFKLRSGVTFHDGTPFTSAAVKASFDRRLAVKGGPAYMVQDAVVTTPDDLTAVVTLKTPNAAFLDYLASPYGPKMESPAGLAKYAGSDNAQTYLQTHDLGTGPYQLTHAQVGTKYSLAQYAKYWGTTSPFKTVELPVFNDVSALQLALDGGAVSVVVAALPSSSLTKYENNPSFNSDLLPTFQSTLITVNPSKKFFASKEARTAFMQSIDQDKLVSQVEGNRSAPATTLYAKGMIADGSDKQNITHDPAVFAKYAKTLPAGTSIVIGYASGNTNAEQMANIVAAQVQATGLAATAQSYPTSDVFGWENYPTKGPDAFIDGNNGPDGGNPYMWGHVFWDKSGGIDYFLCDDPSVDASLNQAVQTGNNEQFAKAAQTYAASGCFMNLSYNMDWVVSQKWLQGVASSQNVAANELDFSLLSIKTEASQ
jgi:peptide/nickel transport system substrate-binding protein